MGPKKKKKPSKKEKLEAQRKAEEEARLAEEERLRIEQEQRKRAEEEAQRKEALKSKHLSEERTLLNSEKEQRAEARAFATRVKCEAINELNKERDWNRYLECRKTPDPHRPSELNEFRNNTSQLPLSNINDALQCFELIADVIEECRDLNNESNEGDAEFLEEARNIRELLTTKQNQLTSHLLQFNKEGLREGSIMEGSSLRFGYGLWLNLERSSRQRKLNFQKLGLKIEVPKQVAISPLSLVVKVESLPHSLYHVFTSLEFQEQNFRDLPFPCQTDYQPLGPLLEIQLFSSLPEDKEYGGWSIREVLSLEESLKVMEYPTCVQAGKQETNNQSETSSTPFFITTPRSRYHPPLDPSPGSQCPDLKIGLWNSNQQRWSIDEISEIKIDSKTDSFAFSTTKLGSFACIVPVSYWFPYRSWFLSPFQRDETDSVQLQIEMQNGTSLVFEVENGRVVLKRPCMEGVQATNARSLLELMQERGLCMVPSDQTSETVQCCSQKDKESEELFCRDIGYLCGKFNITNSKWNKSKEELLCQITEPECSTMEQALNSEESKQDLKSDLKTVSLMRRGQKGVAFVKSQEDVKDYVPPPSYDNDDFGHTRLGKLHFDSIALLESEKAALPFSEKIIESVRNTSPLISEAVSDLLITLKLFSLG